MIGSVPAQANLTWQMTGLCLFAVAPLHCRQMLARGIGDFWGRRWDFWLSDWFRYVRFEPLRRGLLLEHRLLKGRRRLWIASAWFVVLTPAPLIMNEGLLHALQLWAE